MSSSDGFCSTLSFAPGELGQPHAGPTSVSQTAVNPSTPASSTTLPTSTHVPSPVKTNPMSAASTGPVPPASPARSSSACSVATQSSAQQNPAGVVNNPTPTLGTVPSVTAAHSAQPATLPLPLTTPPQTPVSSTPQASAASSSVLGKRGESESEGSKDADPSVTQQPKKRRVAPTLISSSTNPTSGDSKS